MREKSGAPGSCISKKSGGVPVLGIAAGNLAEKSVELVYTFCAGEKHERALAGDYLNSALLAECDRLLADRSFAACPVHPDATNAGIGAGRPIRSVIPVVIT